MRALWLLLILVFLGGAGYWFWTTTPQYSIEQAKNAVKAHDLPKFQTYVNIDSVSGKMVDDFLTEPMQRLSGGSSLANILIAGVVGLLRPTLASAIKSEVENFVVNGRFYSAAKSRVALHAGDRTPQNDISPEDPTSENGPGGQMTLAQYDKKFGFRKHAFKSVKYVHTNGDIATAGLILHNEVYNADLLLEMELHQVGSHWQITELTNFPDFVANIVRLQMHTVNEPDTAPN